MINTSFIPTWDTKAAAEKAAKGSLGSKAVLRDVYKSNNEIFAAGCYRTDSGKTVQLSGPDDPMLNGTIVYSKELRSRNQVPVVAAKLETGVENDDCMRVAKKMLDKGLNPAVLNLADCYTACGWYPRGSRAQEESVCRLTTLSRSLYQYYTENMAQTVGVAYKGKGYPMDYHFGGIYSPGVTVFRDSANSFRFALTELYRQQIAPARAEGLSAAVYTQLSDVENELNGLLTYDRRMAKVAPDLLRNIVSV